MKSELKAVLPRPELHPCDFGPHWNNVYYDILQEYYWDPKLIGRVPANPAIFANDREMLGRTPKFEPGAKLGLWWSGAGIDPNLNHTK